VTTEPTTKPTKRSSAKTKPAKPSDSVPDRLRVQLREGAPYLLVDIIGGQGGVAFNFSGGDSGNIVQKIGVWAGPWMIKAVRIWLTDGRMEQFGNPSGTYSEFAFARNELIDSMSLWSNDNGTRLGAIKFRTNQKREFFAAMTDRKLPQEHPIDTGSGICVGAMGRSGTDIDCIGFIFVKPIRESVMSEMNYPTIGLVSPDVRPDELKSITYKNKSGEQQTYTLRTESTLVFKESWSRTVGAEFAVSVTVKAGVPKVAETEKGFSFKVSASGTWGQENTTSKSEKWEFPITVPPHQTIEAIVSIGRADISLPYSAKVRIITTDGSKWDFNVSGVYEGITYTKATVSVNPID
jgi:hypothetical protein